MEGSKIPQPHAICIPFPAQGHINPMLKLAKLLCFKGFHITFVLTEFNYNRLIKARGSDSIKGHPSFRFETIPDGLPPSDVEATQDVPSLCDSTGKNCLVPFRELVERLNNDSDDDVPPVSSIVSDGIMSFTLVVAQELGIPDVLFWTNGAAGVLAYLNYRLLIQKGYTPLKDSTYLTNGYLDTVIDWIPGMKGIKLNELPTFIRTTDPNDIMLNFAMTQVERVHKSSALILNTYDALEQEMLDSLRFMIQPPILTIGPLHMLLDQIPQDHWLNSLRSNLWKEEPDCLEWLNSKEPNSVIYVNFGSVAVMTPEQLKEFAWGLANSKKNFLWAIRPDLVIGETSISPEQFIEETKERGLLVSWCPQEDVLKHPSISGFLTHCGWNSTFESICAGVPMICWPFFAEQQTNCWYCCKHLGIGIETNSNLGRYEVEGFVNELMVGDKGKELRYNSNKWKKFAQETITPPNGTSHKNMEELVSKLLPFTDKVVFKNY